MHLPMWSEDALLPPATDGELRLMGCDWPKFISEVSDHENWMCISQILGQPLAISHMSTVEMALTALLLSHHLGQRLKGRVSALPPIVLAPSSPSQTNCVGVLCCSCHGEGNHKTCRYNKSITWIESSGNMLKGGFVSATEGKGDRVKIEQCFLPVKVLH